MKPNLQTTSWAIVSFLWSSTHQAAVLEVVLRKWAKFAAWVDCHYLTSLTSLYWEIIMEHDKYK